MKQKNVEVVNLSNVPPMYYKTWDQMSVVQRINSLFPEWTLEEKEVHKEK